MAFKVKNLMIHVLPDAEEKSLPQAAQDCRWLSLCVFSALLCTPISFGPTPLPSSVPSDPEALATLKGHLQEALANVQAQEQKVNEQMAPQTVEEAQALEDHLSAALDEVRRQKEELQKKATGGQE